MEFFLTTSRTFKYKRWVKITLRTLHLIGTAGVAGGYFFEVDRHHWQPFFILTILSGILFIILEIWSNPIWIIQLRGLVIIFKLILIICIPILKGYEFYLIIVIIIISSYISHAPGDVRYYSVFHGKRIDITE